MNPSKDTRGVPTNIPEDSHTERYTNREDQTPILGVGVGGGGGGTVLHMIPIWLLQKCQQHQQTIAVNHLLSS